MSYLDRGDDDDRYEEYAAEDDPPRDWRAEAYENGEEPCIDARGHSWTVSDENEELCYCSKCGCYEY